MVYVPGLYRNKKNGNIYETKGIVENATNGHEGLKVVLYSPYGDADPRYGRDLEEFIQKFERVT